MKLTYLNRLFFSLLLLAGIPGILFSGSPLGAHEEGHHKAFHNGTLNTIEQCETGHVEVLLDGDLLKCWFVGGGNQTGRAVTIPDREILLTVKDGTGTDRALVLKAQPLKLAEETMGSCSFFQGRAPWLKEMKSFSATGSVHFKGKSRKLIIVYPGGYHPGHDH